MFLREKKKWKFLSPITDKSLHECYKESQVKVNTSSFDRMCSFFDINISADDSFLKALTESINGKVFYHLRLGLCSSNMTKCK